MTKKHHTIISGTGRAGTTFLVQLLTVLGLDTGFKDHNSAILSNCRAGMEIDLRQENDAPYIVKSPWLCDYLSEVLQEKDIVIDHAFIPIRDLYSAAESRRFVQKTSDPSWSYDNHIPGGLWQTEKPEEQETILTHKLYKLMHTLAKYDIDMTLLYFPRTIYEPDYLYKKLVFLLQEIDYDSFLAAFKKVSRPELVNNFGQTSDFMEVSGLEPLTSCLPLR